MKQKITSFIWFDTEARKAADLYKSVFADSKEELVENYDNTPSGTIDIITLTLFNHTFSLMNAGPTFKPTPAISYFINCKNPENIDTVWKALSEGGKILMPLDKYPFAEKYGWCNDKYGVSWQISEGEENKITPAFLFVGDVVGRAGEAIDLYTSIFKGSKIITKVPYKEGDGDKPGFLMYSQFELAGQEFIAMDSSLDHKFTFTEGNSFIIDCQNQEEVDYYWNNLIKDGGEESQCGWLKDKFGVSWQVVPSRLNDLLRDPDKAKSDRVMQCMLKQKKIIISELEKTYREE